MSDEWQPISTAPQDGRWVWGEWPEIVRDSLAHRAAPRMVAIMRWGTPDNDARQYMPHWCKEGRWTPGDPIRWMPINEPACVRDERAKREDAERLNPKGASPTHVVGTP